MQMSGIPFGVTEWSRAERTEHKGETGTSYWQTRNFGDIRVRMVEYTAGYLADHWCEKRHIVLCLEGELETELKDGRKFRLTPGMSYQLGDKTEPHRSFTAGGAKLFIVD
ncbi:MAG TPA: DHCW motif cupin fold protein [Candidatus Acidoferrum sp.]|nr:DHCW motif cupin fold protein [Candidatus Acidoferrum sp.]